MDPHPDRRPAAAPRDQPLDLPAVPSTLPLDRPFTREAARQAGVERRALERLLKRGELVRLVRGVYAAAALVDVPAVRVAAVALAAGEARDDVLVVDRTAAWLHGVDVAGWEQGPVPLDLRRRTPTPGARHRSAPAWEDRDLVRLGPLVVTSPLRTAVDLGRGGPEAFAAVVMDRLLRTGGLRHTELLAELARWSGRTGAVRLRELAAAADGRAVTAGESVLRLGWHRAALPTPTPGLLVRAGDRLVRLALGLADRQFGAVLSGQLDRAEVATDDLARLTDAGWRVVLLREDRVLREDPSLWGAHLVREFHQQLLAQVG
ncbi:type IV toxin-antitoxin system AbiEi family antitoxin domain-containing protein [Nocardioides aurantiacus]|uniref:Putative AbiEi antitoxin of type IV toxin-antitoxin system n=1 Tax=Nocardioides aurantiacus TaxID=86796 RepID=A0A3N2CSV1_9ACTN|nr:type IV toxin-antitoxin system AbiEi family antitoxin domain-containing protein [Nocardioides aurantiacus]ROR90599.1 putative AbiEi antitoxin of type IV toxin-antitoxin system [Nocardioides aurantiacus]